LYMMIQYRHINFESSSELIWQAAKYPSNPAHRLIKGRFNSGLVQIQQRCEYRKERDSPCFSIS
jgi:hypothetical protein